MAPANPPRVAVFGATGAIGQAVCQRFLGDGWQVQAMSRREWQAPEAISGVRALVWDREPAPATVDALAAAPLAAVVWAQGLNCTDSIMNFDEERHVELYDANVLFVLRTLTTLLRASVLARPARLCVIGSIWQNIARPNKLSYCISKAALYGLVQSVALDLGPQGHLINAVLPGALDTPMTRANLNDAQMQRLEDMTPLGRLAKLDDVCSAVAFLCAPANQSITGQFVAIDGGFSHAKFL
jgi:3-oxoacyl-[acyl-carrier protein] reductase